MESSDNKFCVYCTINKLNGKQYYGKSSVRRVTNGYMGSGKILWSAIRKYGKSVFETVILETFETEEEAYVREKELVSREKVLDENVYNVSEGGRGGHSGFITLNNGIGEVRVLPEQVDSFIRAGYVVGRRPESRKQAIVHSHTTLVDRYGSVTACMNTLEVQERMKNVRQRHAREYLHSKALIDKAVATKQQRYGSVTGFLNSPEAMEKKNSTKEIKYGSRMGAANLPEVRRKAAETKKRNNKLRWKLVQTDEFQQWYQEHKGRFRGPYYATFTYLRETGKRLE